MNLKFLSLVCKQLRDISTVLLHDMLVQFDMQPLVNKVSIHVDQVAMQVNSSAQLVNEEPLLVPFQIFDYIISVLILVEIASDIMRVEVVALEVEWRRQFALIV